MTIFEDLTNTCVYICSNSQAAIRAIRKPRTTSKLVRECMVALDALAALHPVCVTWIPGHTGKQGNERADQLARQASGSTFIGPEPSLPISHTVVKTAIWDWACKQHHKCWQDLRTCRQTKEMIKDRSRRRESDLLRLP